MFVFWDVQVEVVGLVIDRSWLLTSHVAMCFRQTASSAWALPRLGTEYRCESKCNLSAAEIE